MTEQFSNLSKEEVQLVKDAPALITLLIAATHKNLNRDGLDKGLDLMKWKKIHARPDLAEYYKEVSTDFYVRLDAVKAQLPLENKDERMKVITERLRKLNAILPKFEQKFAEQLYKSYQELAKGVAEASGGFLGYLSVDYDESKLVSLPMIDDPRTYNV